MKKHFYLLILFCLQIGFCLSQSTNLIKGEIVDKEAQFRIPSVRVQLFQDSILIQDLLSNFDGEYVIKNIEVGRYLLSFQVQGYTPLTREVLVVTGKDVVVNVALEESITQLDEVVINSEDKTSTVDKMASVSTRMFVAEETERYAGSRQDPARMASNFAGVRGSDDSRNDIVIRGNSPLGVLWKMNGLNIPNPNHFSVPGSTGGPVNIINNKTLANSDFYTGAFPAEIGNTTSGAFDLNLRRGNKDKYEFEVQIGVLGLEALAEGPLKKGSKASFLALYRYSTLSLFDLFGINVGTDSKTMYQDATFKVDVPLKNDLTLSFFGVMGYSTIDILISDQKDPSEVDLYGDNDRDQKFTTSMAIMGVQAKKLINDRSFFRSTLGYTIDRQNADHDAIARHVGGDGLFVIDSSFALMNYNYQRSSIAYEFSYNYKLSKRSMLKVGVNYDLHFYSYVDSLFYVPNLQWDVRWDYQGTAALVQPYAQWRYKFNDKLVLNIGWHSQWLGSNNSLSLVEPRLGLKWSMTSRQTLSFGAGIHSQMQPHYVYFYQKKDLNGEYSKFNQGLDFTKSNHFVLSHDFVFSKQMRLKTEAYYQMLYNVPVEIQSSSFSMVNQGGGYARFLSDSLENTGTGYNYGLEMTLEKFFSNNYFFMVTASLYNSKYKGSDGIERSTSFNGNYSTNILGGYSFKLKNKALLNLGVKITMAGGQRYGVVDTLASNDLREVVYKDEQFNEFQFRDYFRTDLKISYVINRKKVGHEIALDIVNVTNRQNLLKITYIPAENGNTDVFRETYQLGLLPIFYYKISF